MKRIVYIALILFISFAGYAQKEEFNRELTFGFHFSTIGGRIGGFDARKAWLVEDNQLVSIGISLAEIKHPKEEAVQYEGFNSFKPGKRNGLYVLRTTFASEHTLFRKYHEDGVKLSFVYGGGPSIGFLKPYFIEFVTGIESGAILTDFAQYDPDVHILDLNALQINSVVSSGGFFRGWGGIKPIPGFNAKIALSFEYGQFNRSISGIEIGLLADIFTQEMVIIPEAKNKSFFTSGYLALYFGRRKYKPSAF